MLLLATKQSAKYLLKSHLRNIIVVEDTTNYTDICDRSYWARVRSSRRIPSLPLHIKSPNYPQPYPHWKRCSWFLDLKDYTNITVSYNTIHTYLSTEFYRMFRLNFPTNCGNVNN